MNKLLLIDILGVCNPDWIETRTETISTSKHGIPRKTLEMEVRRISGFDDGLTVELFTGSSPCECLPTGSYRKVQKAIIKVYEYSAVGSGLHIVLDDENVEDSDILWCLENSIPSIENEEERNICQKCAELLLAMPLKDRERVVRSYGREWW